MTFPERFEDLPEYAFPRLATLLKGRAPGGPEINMTIGEPRHDMPPFLADVLAQAMAGFAKYPPNPGSDDLLAAIADWIGERYGLDVDPARQVMALNGTREGLFNACVALCPETKAGQRPVVLIPNPFYQVYAVAAMAVGAEPVYVPATPETGNLPDFGALPQDILDRTAIAYLCSPSNPQGAVADTTYWTRLIALAEQHDFKVFADECYSEVYRDAPPSGALPTARAMGAHPERVAIFHSLSKRSNLPGLRSGFVSAGPESIARIRTLRAYSGSPLPLPLQMVATRVWQDETHVEQSRALYNQKYAIADRILGDLPGYKSPEAGFFLWLPIPDGETATVKLWEETGVKVLPGGYLGREVDGTNPGHPYIRVAMVVTPDELEDGLTRLKTCLYP
ncbi:aminotransferase class I/II-fold pyridoxal phosphate-dependent enzyme [Actibacterium sp. 188UL27-1]|uniref:aminotransferase class I/II-fold pyridoxal phosphate-dependent enzyme n=1 Tax=Actibacterium sp. 188UL27-1 TaxID=2786961 RepID=UPI00195B30F6|nr:aminotransferase class I/II-fold pyridoxal phosphate-dependent enzyme [Actibacterium sp. 188UL27-1]MBM7065972.1 aminotransferase class I/II-fold pyridoxal phosphate-dependent enzyme [Actibacterium sp. 188UL27-1]